MRIARKDAPAFVHVYDFAVCSYFRQSVFNDTKWGNQRWLDSMLSKAGYGATFRVVWWDDYGGSSKVAAVACLNHANAERMRQQKKLELPDDCRHNTTRCIQ
ncbi:hypothetical protein Pmar_PMAR018149 [Perkinsus marinus ATCC 50983]|uniref:Uncharacterized protein n=1 Tax=Perkinsus marinus (strain ATCC 50983 / TXsc) TaxID=423536 RepID=C5KFW5_PERM5|nr:hypothetical protein Pmar_PMAR018149 [Perkinsus marinus ATCC 50983]EER16613.1 hypothetical protein Pmar_PMAR018149 [Perkinsus marinus ATCC 50983]|eukprot:XP_002784817.1 hypothetical protein Pmar_PMAR018149 [Perkinsus marinus ATCC 50983]